MEHLILVFIKIIPRRIGISFFRALGLLLFYLMPTRRETAMTNLDIAFGDTMTRKEKVRIAKDSFKNSIAMAFDFLKILQMPRSGQDRLVRIAGEENLKAAVEMGKGVIAVSAHMGNFPLMLALISSREYKVNVVTRSMRSAWADSLYTGMLNRFGIGTITKERVAAGIIRALKKGEIIGYVLDQNMQKDAGIFVDFFGRKASTIRGLSTFSGKYGSPILPAFIVSTPTGHRIFLEKPYFYNAADEDELQLTQRFTTMIEGWIREYPEQWIWYHRRFKTRPEGEERIYPRKMSLTKRLRRYRRKRRAGA
jgi:KDO2-lipid IV(A) lauroyltransferase